eukprot:10468434-Karenia_brevis.AAC.1
MGASSSNPLSPEKQLRRDVMQLREASGRQGDYAMGRIGDVELKAELMLAEQTRKFEQAAKQYERDARDIAESEMMREKAS